MGIGYSHESQLLHKLYNHYKKRHNIPIVGGSENDPRNVVGGYSALEDYGNSVYSKAKEELIRGLAKDVSGILGVQNVETGPIDAVIKKFTEVLPKPGTGKGTLKADPAKHAKLCSLLAKAINKRYEMKVIDENAEPHEICQKVAELMYSLFTGLHSEFLNVAGDVSRIVKNLEVLQGIVDSANQKIMNDLAKSNDGAVSSVAETTKDVYKKISDEIRRQHVLLSNIINSSIGPVGSSLITLLADNKDFSGLVEGLKKTTGTQYFGDRLAYLLSGISSIAHSANLVDKALKKIGMSVADYKNVKGLTDLRKKVYDAIAKKKPSTGEMHKLMVAADILYRNDLAHDDIAKYLEKKNDSVRGGSYGGDELDPVDPSFADMVDEATWEDTSSTPFSGRLQSYRKSIGKQIRDQRKYRNMLFSDFNLQIKSQYASLISIIAKISQKVGGEIPISDKLERFIRLLNNFSAIQPDRKNLHIALSSYRNDATSNFIKYQYMDYLEIIKDEAEYMGNSPGGMYFREIAGVISKLIHIIDDFNLNFTKTLSEFHMDVGPSGQKKKLGSRDDNISGLREYGGEHDNQHGHQHGHHHRHKKHNRGIHDKHDSDTTDSFLEQSSKEIEEENNELASELVEDEEIKGGNEIESSINSNGNVKLGGESTVEEILGGIIRGFSDYDFKHFKTLKKSIREMDYFFRIANIKSSLRKVSAENKANVDNYDNILGEEAGWMIDQINKKYNAYVESTKEDAPSYTKYGFDSEMKLWIHPYKEGNGNFKDDVTNKYSKSLKTNFKEGFPTNGDQYKGGYLFLIEYIRTAKIEMIEAAQALDLYLSQFTQKIEQDPDTIKNFVEIIEQLEIVAKWFNDKSGDALVGVFEAFPWAVKDKATKDNAGEGIDHSLFRGNGINTEDEYTKKIDKNINNDLKSDYSVKNEHYYKDISDSDAKVGMAYVPRLMTREQAIQFVKQIERSVKGVRALENIVNIFSKVNSHTSGEIKTFMNAGMIFKALMKYCVASVIGIGYRLVEGQINESDKKHLKSCISVPTNPIINFTNASGGEDATDSNSSAVYIKTGITLRLSSEFVRFHTDGNSPKYIRFCDPFEFKQDLQSRYSLTDKLFEMCIKSMVTKIFVVIGSYSLFNRPAKSNHLFKSINASYVTNPLRQIIGGASKSDSDDNAAGGRSPVTVVPEALELYIRLPLLVEWYRTVFEFNSQLEDPKSNEYSRQSEPLVSLVPEMDNIWRNLCVAIMIDSANIKEGGYPSDIARKIIAAISEIYLQYKSKKSDITCKEIIQEFVLEINRRYGFMKRSEIKSYLETRSMYDTISDTTYPDEDDNLEYDILNANETFGRRVAPSDKFRTFSINKPGSREDMMLFYKAVRRFRLSVEANLLLTREVDDAGNPKDFNMTVTGDIDMDQVIRITKHKLNKAQTPEEKYNIIFSQLHGVDKFSNIDQNKLLILHETVVHPLTVLYFVYLILNDYNKLMVSMNLEHYIAAINKYFSGDINGHGVNQYFYGKLSDKSKAVDLSNKSLESELANPQLWVPLYLLEQNNSKFKGVNAQNKYGLQDANYRAHVEGMYPIDDVIQYFNYGIDKSVGVEKGVVDGLSSWQYSKKRIGNGINQYLSDYDLSIADILSLNHTTNSDDESKNNIKKMVFRRLALNRSHLMETILRRIMNITADLNDLVDVNFSGESKYRYPSLNFDKLEDLCTSLYQHAKQSLSKLRKVLPSQMIYNLESNQIIDGKTKSTNAVSLFYLKDQLFDRLFKNRFGNGLDDGNTGLKHIWLELTREHEFNFITKKIGSHANVAVKLTGGDTDNVEYIDNNGKSTKVTGGSDPRVMDKGAQFMNGRFVENANNLNKNKKYYESLHREYCFDSYSSVISKLLGWSHEEDVTELSKCIGVRSVTKNSQLNEFPAHYMPLFNGGESASNVKSTQLKTVLTLLSSSSDLNERDGGAYHANPKFATIQAMGSGMKDRQTYDYALYAGFHNLYDYNMTYSSATQLSESHSKFDKAANPGGPDHITPDENKDIPNRIPDLGIICKFNNIVYNYMKLFIDDSSKRIYKPLIDKFVNGYCAPNILQGKNINDTVVTLQTGDHFGENKRDAILAGEEYARDRKYPVSSFPLFNIITDNAKNIGCGIFNFDIPERAVLFATLASVIRTIYISKVDKTTGTISMHLEENLANISDYQKEMMRAYLPVFEKQLEMIMKRADFIKNVMDLTSCKVYKWCQHYKSQDTRNDVLSRLNTNYLYDKNGKLSTLANAGVTRNQVFKMSPEELDSSYLQPLREGRVEHESSRKTYLINQAGDVIAAVKSMLLCINTVQKELSDIPLYFETYKDSIVDFNNRNQRLPIMPLSMLSAIMNFSTQKMSKDGLTSSITPDTDPYKEDDERLSSYLMPLLAHEKGVGSVQFKFAYGTRGLLSNKQKPLLDYIPSMAAIADSDRTGGKTGGLSTKFDKSSIQGITESIVHLTRFILDHFNHVQYLDQHNYDKVRKLVIDNQYALAKMSYVDNTPHYTSTTSNVLNLSCQTSKFGRLEQPGTSSFWANPQNIINLIEDDNVKQTLYRLTSCMRQNSTNVLFTSDRRQLQLINILDLNIVPFNFHSLQREIPFVNLINYSHTFDHIVKETIGVKFKGTALTSIHGHPPEGVGHDGDMTDPDKTNPNPQSEKAKYMDDLGEQVYSYNEFVATIHPEDQLVRHLIYPLGFRRLSEYVNHVYKIMAGNTSLTINRPKYLSDQLWNKVLLNNLYDKTYGDTTDYLASARRVSILNQVTDTAEFSPSAISNFYEKYYNEPSFNDKICNELYDKAKLMYSNFKQISSYVKGNKNWDKFNSHPEYVNILRILCNTITNGGDILDKLIYNTSEGTQFKFNKLDYNTPSLNLIECITAYNNKAAAKPKVGYSDENIHPSLFIADFISVGCEFTSTAELAISKYESEFNKKSESSIKELEKNASELYKSIKNTALDELQVLKLKELNDSRGDNPEKNELSTEEKGKVETELDNSITKVTIEDVKKRLNELITADKKEADVENKSEETPVAGGVDTTKLDKLINDIISIILYSKNKGVELTDSNIKQLVSDKQKLLDAKPNVTEINDKSFLADNSSARVKAMVGFGYEENGVIAAYNACNLHNFPEKGKEINGDVMESQNFRNILIDMLSCAFNGYDGGKKNNAAAVFKYPSTDKYSKAGLGNMISNLHKDLLRANKGYNILKIKEDSDTMYWLLNLIVNGSSYELVSMFINSIEKPSSRYIPYKIESLKDLVTVWIDTINPILSNAKKSYEKQIVGLPHANYKENLLYTYLVALNNTLIEVLNNIYNYNMPKTLSYSKERYGLHANFSKIVTISPMKPIKQLYTIQIHDNLHFISDRRYSPNSGPDKAVHDQAANDKNSFDKVHDKSQVAHFDRNRRPVEYKEEKDESTLIISNDKSEILNAGLSAQIKFSAPRTFPISKRLTFMGTNGKETDVYTSTKGNQADLIQRLNYEGYMRYNTRLVRWIEWITHTQRVIRILMRQQLDWIQDPVVREHNALAEGVTEFGPDNLGYQLQDFD